MGQLSPTFPITPGLRTIQKPLEELTDGAGSFHGPRCRGVPAGGAVYSAVEPREELEAPAASESLTVNNNCPVYQQSEAKEAKLTKANRLKLQRCAVKSLSEEERRTAGKLTVWFPLMLTS